MPNFISRLSNWTDARRKRMWLLLLLLIAAVVAVVLIPAFLIVPFKAQTPRVLAFSYVMRSWSPWLTVFGSLIILTLLIGLWPNGHWWSRIFMVILLLPVIGVTWLARQNHFLWLFNPLPDPAYAKVAEASYVDDNDRVLAVTLNNEAVAYPIRLMGYHHVVEDTVGGVPIVATY
jgi:hypothetical protein